MGFWDVREVVYEIYRGVIIGSPLKVLWGGGGHTLVPTSVSISLSVPM